jgi:hypothetical protein
MFEHLLEATADQNDPEQHARSQDYRRRQFITRDEFITALSMLDGNRPVRNIIEHFGEKWGID